MNRSVTLAVCASVITQAAFAASAQQNHYAHSRQEANQIRQKLVNSPHRPSSVSVDSNNTVRATYAKNPPPPQTTYQANSRQEAHRISQDLMNNRNRPTSVSVDSNNKVRATYSNSSGGQNRR